MNFKIRQCEISDTKAIYDLNVCEMGYDYKEEKTKEKLKELLESDKDKILVALIDNIIVGYVHANNHDVIYAPHMKNIMGIAVSSNVKKQGIGRALLKAIEEWAQESGACGIRIVSGATRTGAHEFYRLSWSRGIVTPVSKVIKQLAF
ncbi:MAG: GNAT family N-acetyltransferase [Synergistaceae bacterium]|nr:GNAT family N-acetyltransferase [Synergistaceae bacterium]